MNYRDEALICNTYKIVPIYVRSGSRNSPIMELKPPGKVLREPPTFKPLKTLAPSWNEHRTEWLISRHGKELMNLNEIARRTRQKLSANPAPPCTCREGRIGSSCAPDCPYELALTNAWDAAKDELYDELHRSDQL